jgi:hypothetical protein
MQKTAGHILRSDEVKLEGTVRVGTAQLTANQQGSRSSGAAAQQVRIVENHPEFTVIEVICSCGARTYLKCEYDGVCSKE